MPESFSHHHFKDQRPDVKFFETFQWSCQDGKWHLKWQAHIIMASNCTRAVLCSAVWCIDLYTKAQKVHGRAGSSESLKIWRGNIFSSERTSFAESVRGWGTSPPVMPPFPTAPSMAGGWGVSPVSVRSYGKYAAAGDISEQPSFLSDDVSIYNLQNACLCCYWIFFFNECSIFFSALGIGNRQTISCVIAKYKVPL